MKAPRIPKYRKHSTKSRALVEWKGKRYYLPGDWNSEESIKAYKAFLRTLTDDTPAAVIPADLGKGLSVAEAAEVYLDFAAIKFRDRDRDRDGGEKHKPELAHIRGAFTVLLNEHAETPLHDLRPRTLKNLRAKMASATKTIKTKAGPKTLPANWSRGYINRQFTRIIRFLRWCVSEELLEARIYQAAKTIEPLRDGDIEAPESRIVSTVEQALVDATLPHLSATVSAMVKVHRHSGMRSGELCRMKLRYIDRSLHPWEYRPDRFKKNPRAKSATLPRIIYLGPNSQSALEPLLDRDPDAYLFSPAETIAQKNAARFQSAKKPKRRPPVTLRRVSSKYTSRTYRRAIYYATKKAGVASWHPHQLRHSKATEIRKLYKLDGAQVALGHASADVTQVYAERDLELARKIALETG